MGAAPAQCAYGISAHCGKLEPPSFCISSTVEIGTAKVCTSPALSIPSKKFATRICCTANDNDSFCEKAPTPILDMVESPIQLKNLSLKELKQLAKEIRLDLLSIFKKTQKQSKASLAAVELTVAIHHVFHAPADKIMWDVGEQAYAHKILTGRRSLMHTLKQKDELSGFTNRSESEFDPFGAGHGCNSISAGLGMAIARDMKGKRERIVTVISNGTTMAGQVYEAMSNAGYMDSDMIVILNDSRLSLYPKFEGGLKTSISALSSTLSKLQSSKSFRKFREVAKGVTKRIGRGMHEWAAKVDEFARGLIGPLGSTLFEELGLYYIGPVDGHNTEDLVCVLQEVASLNSTGPVLVHVITEENREADHHGQQNEKMDMNSEGSMNPDQRAHEILPRTYSDCFVESLLIEADGDRDIVMVHAGMEMDPCFQLFQEKLPERFFDVGMAEQHAVTFSAGLSCGGLKPFCMIPSSFLQRAYDQIGKGRILAEGKDVALLGYGSMVHNCLKARTLLLTLGIEVTVADARFCKPLDIGLLRELCKNHDFLVTVEEGSIGGFGSHVAQFIALDGQLDGRVKWRPIVLPDNYIEHTSSAEQLTLAGLTGHHIAATALSLLGRTKEALLLMT
ncbi:probable 1-deoxy-D-xylulose-5-phosphate synthase, chloroplastic isoform X2 [Punica granatum]|uniref:Probable 1-deoxy-D-xylulose-5-phosphate synthase, chloroplastic isoform X2 n=1 Tax=Punica granatum TaxID=22663 RepID=A0A6P8E5K2_PUNGR|nr:probable 1-deoxy-D-xylulose-5-phosphate synthase, chloroplastic isoform X2 [Punica granatum]